MNPRIDFNFDSVFATEVSVQTSLSLSTFLVFDFLVKNIYVWFGNECTLYLVGELGYKHILIQIWLIIDPPTILIGCFHHYYVPGQFVRIGPPILYPIFLHSYLSLFIRM